MSQRGGRVLILLAFVVAVIAAALFVVDREQRLERQYSELAAIDAVGRTIEALALEMRAGQQAYVAAGQGEGFWASQVGATRQDLSRRLDSLRDLLTAAAAASAAESARSQLGRLGEIDKQALEYVKAEQLLMASDLVFTEGLGLTRGIVEQTRLAVVREREAREATRTELRRGQAWTVGLLAVLAVLVAAGLGLRGVRPEVEPREEAFTADRGSVLDNLLTERTVAPPPRPADAGPPVEPQADLGAVADLCTDFARVIDPGELPGLLERSARLIGASGLIVWLMDERGSKLKPALHHGYSNQVLSMMGAIERDGDNATATAFREARARTVPAADTNVAALVVPLISAAGCVGVVAVEVPAGKETRASTRHLASLVAAQLAALVAVPGTTTDDATAPKEPATS